MQIWYDPKTFQVEAIYRGCAYGGTLRQENGQVPIDVSDDFKMPDGSKISRDARLVLRDGQIVAVEPNPNPYQPTPSVPDPTPEEIMREAAGISKENWAAAKQRIIERRSF